VQTRIEALYNEARDRRVTIFRRDDGTYGLLWEEYSDDPREQCWVIVGRRTESFIDTLETARREATGRLEQWRS
jgi:8-oxo-dGTP pyrophosphatase MutT (NUDIX family)